MSFAIQTQVIYGNNGGNPVIFDFSQSGTGIIGAYVYGIQQFTIAVVTYQSLEDINITLTVSSGGNNSPQVALQQTLAGQNIDVENSWTEVTVLAWMGSENPPDIFINTPQEPVPFGQISQTSTIQTEYPPVVAAAALAGFSVSFGDQTGFMGIGASAGVVSNQMGTPSVSAIATGTLTGYAASSGEAYVGVIALTKNESGLSIGIVSDQGDQTPDQLSFDTGAGNLEAAAVFLQSFFLQFPMYTQDSELAFLGMAVGAFYISLNNPGPGQIQFSSNRYMQGADMVDGQTTFFNAASFVATYLVVALPSTARGHV